MNLFSQLTPEQQEAFRLWARENYTAFEPINGVWHPVVQDECTRINAEYGQRFELKENAIGEITGEI